MRLFTACAAVVALLAPTVASAQAPSRISPRESVAEIARTIDDTYFDVARARSIADRLRSDAAAGTFDGMNDPDVLAQALTARLSPEDGHFNVRWTGATPPPQTAQAPASGPPGPSPEDQARERRGGYGFRAVEHLSGNLGYIRLSGFADFDTADSAAGPRRGADAALALIADTDAVIIDLRGNGGGSPAMVGYLVSAFTPPDADIYNTFHGRDGERSMVESERPKLLHPSPRLETPLYVLTDGGTGSAAESFAYTLQSAHRAVIVGEPTAGAANPGGDVSTASGFQIFVSFAAPRNPITGSNWEGGGVKPDVAVAADAALDRARVLAFETILASNPSETQTFEANWQMETLRAPPSMLDAGALAAYVGVWGPLTTRVEAGALYAKREGRPERRLRPIADDLFEIADASDTRYAFERAANGRIVSVQMRRSDGDTRRFQ